MHKGSNIPIVEGDRHLQKLCRRADALGDISTCCCIYAVILDLVNWVGVSDARVRIQGNLTSPGQNVIAQTDHSVIVRSSILEIGHV